MVHLPIACPGGTPPPRGDSDCHVPLGQPCRSDSDCGPGPGGVCLSKFGPPNPGGYCSLYETDGGCRPSDGVRFTSHDEPGAIWLKACQTDADCRPGGLYQCDRSLGGCLSSGLVGQLWLFSSRPLEAACR